MKGYTVLLFGLLALFYISASEAFSVKFVAEDEEGSDGKGTSGRSTAAELKKSDNSDGLVKSANGDKKRVITSAKGGAAERASEDSSSNNRSSKSSDKSKQKRDTRSMYRNMKSSKRAEEASKENMIRVLEKLAVEAARLAGVSTRSARNNLGVDPERSSSPNNLGMTPDRLDALVSALAVVDAMKAVNTEDMRKSVRDNAMALLPNSLVEGDSDCGDIPPELCLLPPPQWTDPNTLPDAIFKPGSTTGGVYLPGTRSHPPSTLGVRVDELDSTPSVIPVIPPGITTLPLPIQVTLPGISSDPIIITSDVPQVMVPVVPSKRADTVDMYAGLIDLLLQEMYGKLDGQIPIPGSVDSESGQSRNLRGKSQAILHIFNILSSLGIGDNSRSAQG